MKALLASVLAALVLLFPLALFAEDAPVPPLSGRVVDLVGALTPAQKSEIEQSLQAFEQRKGSQIALLIVGTTYPEPIESYGIRVAEAWKIGRQATSDGVVVIIAKSDRNMRIEVGYGLEGAIPDATARRLIDEVFAPHFKQDDYYGGISAGVAQLVKLIDGEALPEPPRRSSGQELRSLEGYFVVFLAIVFAVGGALRAALGRFPAAAIVGGGTGALAWFIAAPLLLAVVVGAVGFFLTLLGGGIGGMARMGRGGRGGGWGGGGFGGGGFGGGGGGFSGGGGGFGGGGASGRW